MNKTFTILLGLAAGTVWAFAAYTKKGRIIRRNMSRKMDEIKDTMTNNIEKKARSIHDSAVSYS